MKRIYFLILITLGLFVFVGCVDMDTSPEGDTVTSAQKEEIYGLDPEKGVAAVNAVFATFNQYEPNYTALGAARHNDYGYPSVMMFTDHNGYDLVSADVGYNWNGSNLDYSDREFSSYECQILWNDMYKMIYTSNNLIESYPTADNAQSKFYKAQGLSVRAFSYWILAQLYQFNYADHKSDPCVPLITDANRGEAGLSGIGRSTVEEVYTQIMTDLDSAINLLTVADAEGITRDDKRYVDISVAYGLRARVNLTMENWAEAASDAAEAIALSTASPASIEAVSVPTFWQATETNWMWGIIISETDDVATSGIVNWISHMGSLNYGYANYSQGKQINMALYEAIPSTDVRKGWWLDANQVSENLDAEQQAFMEDYSYAAYTQVKFAPYNNEVGGSLNANDVPLMRIEEMYLIQAEAEYMSTGGGQEILETFVTTYRDPSYTASGDIQEDVFFQRRIELWGEGLNWFDVMRLQKDVDRRGGGYPDATMVFNIEAGSDILLWRIPEAEIEANLGLDAADNNPSASRPTPVTDTK